MDRGWIGCAVFAAAIGCGSKSRVVGDTDAVDTGDEADGADTSEGEKLDVGNMKFDIGDWPPEYEFPNGPGTRCGARLHGLFEPAAAVVEIANVDGQGSAEVVVMLRSPRGRIETHRPLTPDAFELVETQEDAFGDLPASAASGDFNGDGFADLISSWNTLYPSGGGSFDTSLRLGDGTGAFSPLDVGLKGAMEEEVRLADLDGDGVDDVVSVASSRLEVVIGGAETAVQTETGDTPIATWTLEDVNGDRLLDFVAASGATAQAFLLAPDGSATFGPETEGATGTFGDFDGDGVLEILDWNDGSFTRWIHTGDGRFTADPPVSVGSPTVLWGARPADFNADGRTDLFVADRVSRGVEIYLTDDQGIPRQRETLCPDIAPQWVDAQDIDGDGAAELALTFEAIPGYGNNPIVEDPGGFLVAWNDGSGGFELR